MVTSEIVVIDLVEALIGVVGSEVNGVRHDQYRTGQVDLRPSAGALIAESGAHMSAGVLRPFVKADRRDAFGHRALEFGAEFDGFGIVLRYGDRPIVCAE